jgi:hypothetical protein
VDEDEWIDPFVWHAPRGQRLEDLEAHHRGDVGVLPWRHWRVQSSTRAVTW